MLQYKKSTFEGEGREFISTVSKQEVFTLHFTNKGS